MNVSSCADDSLPRDYVECDPSNSPVMTLSQAITTQCQNAESAAKSFQILSAIGTPVGHLPTSLTLMSCSLEAKYPSTVIAPGTQALKSANSAAPSNAGPSESTTVNDMTYAIMEPEERERQAYKFAEIIHRVYEEMSKTCLLEVAEGTDHITPISRFWQKADLGDFESKVCLKAAHEKETVFINSLKTKHSSGVFEDLYGCYARICKGEDIEDSKCPAIMFMLSNLIFHPRIISFSRLFGGACLSMNAHSNIEAVIIKFKELSKRAKRLFYVQTIGAKQAAEAPESEHVAIIASLIEYILGASPEVLGRKTKEVSEIHDLLLNSIEYISKIHVQQRPPPPNHLSEIKQKTEEAHSVLRRVFMSGEDDVSEYSKRNPVVNGSFLMRLTVGLRLARTNAVVLSSSRKIKLSTFHDTYNCRISIPYASGDSEGTFSELMGYSTFLGNLFVANVLKASAFLAMLGISLKDRKGKVSSDDTAIRFLFVIISPRLATVTVGTRRILEELIRSLLGVFRISSGQEVNPSKVIIGSDDDKIGPIISVGPLSLWASRASFSVFKSIDVSSCLTIPSLKILSAASHMYTCANDIRDPTPVYRASLATCTWLCHGWFPNTSSDSIKIWLFAPREWWGGGHPPERFFTGADGNLAESCFRYFISEMREGFLLGPSKVKTCCLIFTCLEEWISRAPFKKTGLSPHCSVTSPAKLPIPQKPVQALTKPGLAELSNENPELGKFLRCITTHRLETGLEMDDEEAGLGMGVSSKTCEKAVRGCRLTDSAVKIGNYMTTARVRSERLYGGKKVSEQIKSSRECIEAFMHEIRIASELSNLYSRGKRSREALELSSVMKLWKSRFDSRMTAVEKALVAER